MQYFDEFEKSFYEVILGCFANLIDELCEDELVQLSLIIRSYGPYTLCGSFRTGIGQSEWDLKLQ